MRVLGVAVVLVAVGCRETTTVRRDPTPSASTSASMAKAAPKPPSKHALDGYPPPTEADAVGCSIVGAWDYSQPGALRFHASSPPFARFGNAKKAELTVVEGPSPVAFAELSSDKLRAFGFVTEPIHLRAARPFVFVDYLVAGHQARFLFRGGKAGKVDVELELGKFLVPTSPARELRACDELALTEASFVARDALPEPTEKRMQLPEKRRIPLRKDVAGPAVAELDTSVCSVVLVDVLARSGPDARIFVESCAMDPELDYHPIGWVPEALLLPNTSGTGGSWGIGGGHGWSSGISKRRRVRCTHEVPLVAEQDGERRLVGIVAPDVLVRVLDPTSEGMTEIRPLIDFTPSAGVKLMTKETVLADCKDEPTASSGPSP